MLAKRAKQSQDRIRNHRGTAMRHVIAGLSLLALVGCASRAPPPESRAEAEWHYADGMARSRCANAGADGSLRWQRCYASAINRKIALPNSPLQIACEKTDGALRCTTN